MAQPLLVAAEDSTLPRCHPCQLNMPCFKRMFLGGAGPSAYNVGPPSGLRTHSAAGTLKGAARFRDAAARAKAEFPGPGQYRVPTGVGQQLVSTKRSIPEVSFATAHRDASSKVRCVSPACQACKHRLPSRLDCAALPALAGITKPLLLHGAQIFISADHEKSNYGIGSPGPGTCNPPKCIGRPELSTNSSTPAWGFGTGKLGSSYPRSMTPGPGEYYA